MALGTVGPLGTFGPQNMRGPNLGPLGPKAWPDSRKKKSRIIEDIHDITCDPQRNHMIIYPIEHELVVKQLYNGIDI